MRGDEADPRSDFRLDWPEPARDDERDLRPRDSELDLGWEAPPSPPGAGASEEGGVGHGTGHRGFRVRLRARPGGGPSPDATDPHRSCREEIDRLEALVSELRREIRTLRQRAQVRDSAR